MRTMTASRDDDVAQLVEALLRAVHRAIERVDADTYDHRLQALLDEARDAHAALRQRLTCDDGWQLDEARAVYDEMAYTLTELDGLLAESQPPG
jgi:hypothetical protein